MKVDLTGKVVVVTVRMCPESYAGDILHRLSRRTYGPLMALVEAADKRSAGKPAAA